MNLVALGILVEAGIDDAIVALNAQSKGEAVRYLTNEGLCEFYKDDTSSNGTSYSYLRVTDKGTCFLEHIKKLELPVQAWSMP